MNPQTLMDLVNYACIAWCLGAMYGAAIVTVGLRVARRRQEGR